MTILFRDNDTVLSTENTLRLTGCAAQTGLGPQEPTGPEPRLKAT